MGKCQKFQRSFTRSFKRFLKSLLLFYNVRKRRVCLSLKLLSLTHKLDFLFPFYENSLAPFDWRCTNRTLTGWLLQQFQNVSCKMILCKRVLKYLWKTRANILENCNMVQLKWHFQCLTVSTLRWQLSFSSI